MKTEKQKFQKELEELAKKHGVKNLSACCQMGDTMCGIIGINSETDAEFFESAMLISRLYQSAREKTMKLLEE